MLAEFKKFAFKGNLMDMAVGIIIGGAFGTVVKSLVDDVMMPILGWVTPGNLDFSEEFGVLKMPEGAGEGVIYNTIAEAKAAGATILPYGNFLTSTISFLIIAFVLFIIVKKFVAAFDKEEAEEKPKVADDVKLLTEIRDLLKEQKS